MLQNDFFPEDHRRDPPGVAVPHLYFQGEPYLNPGSWKWFGMQAAKDIYSHFYQRPLPHR